jgi:PAS domain S-box-containing protein
MRKKKNPASSDMTSDISSTISPINNGKAKKDSSGLALTREHSFKNSIKNPDSCQGTYTDINEHVKREEELNRLNRTLKALSDSSKALMRVTEESEYLREVCKIIIEDCGHKMVWIGYAEDDEYKSVRPVAYSGFEKGYLETLNISWADTERGKGPTGSAIRTGKPSICRNMLDDPLFKPWREEAIKRGYASSIVFPLKEGTKTYGAISIYSSQPDPFSEDEIKLLTELADNLSYGIISIRLRIAHDEAEKALRESEERFKAITSSSPDHLLMQNIKLEYTFVKNPQLGLTEKDMIGKTDYDILSKEDADKITRVKKQVLKTGKAAQLETFLISPQGQKKYFEGSYVPRFNNIGQIDGLIGYFKNITERVQMEEDLLKSEEQYRTLFNSMTEGFALHEIICDENGEPIDYRFLEINPSFERLTGLKKEDVLGRVMTEVLPDDDPQWIKIYADVALTGNPIHFEHFSQALKRHFEIFSYCPSPGLFAVLFIDITERKQAEEELNIHRSRLEELVKERTAELEIRNRQLENEINERVKSQSALKDASAYNRSLIEASLDPLVTIGADGKIMDVNHSTEQITGFSRQELIGTDFSDYFTEPDKARSGYEKVFKEGAVYDYPLEIQHIEGQVTPVLYNASVYRNETGEVVGVFAAAREITELKKAQEMLQNINEELEHRVLLRTAELEASNYKLRNEIIERKQAEENFKKSAIQWKATFDAVNDVIWLLDNNYRIIRCNSATEKYFKKDIMDILGSYCWEIAHGASEPVCDCPYMQLKQGMERKTCELQSGQHWLDVSVDPIFDDKGNMNGAVHIIRDITSRKHEEKKREKLQEQLRHSQKMESLGIVTGGIAHDFNNLLQNIIGNQELALLGMKESSAEKECIKTASLAAQNAADLTSQMLAYSGRGHFVLEQVNLNHIIMDMDQVLRSFISKDTALSYRLSNDLPKVNADKIQIRQIIQNLVINASEAIGASEGQVRVSTGIVQCRREDLESQWIIGQSPDGLYVYLEITDTGCGMDDKILDKIFDPFFSTKNIGRGLGLAAVHGIIRGHKCSVQINSKLGTGTEFRILFPVSEKNDDTEGKGVVEKLETGKSKVILFVDDEAELVNIGVTALEISGYKVLAASNGIEALEIFNSNLNTAKEEDRIACIILDYIMPRMDGEEAMREFKRIAPGVPVILISGYGEDFVFQHFNKNDLAGFIKKPYSLKALTELLKETLLTND